MLRPEWREWRGFTVPRRKLSVTGPGTMPQEDEWIQKTDYFSVLSMSLPEAIQLLWPNPNSLDEEKHLIMGQKLKSFSLEPWVNFVWFRVHTLTSLLWWKKDPSTWYGQTGFWKTQQWPDAGLRSRRHWCCFGGHSMSWQSWRDISITEEGMQHAVQEVQTGCGKMYDFSK